MTCGTGIENDEIIWNGVHRPGQNRLDVSGDRDEACMHDFD